MKYRSKARDERRHGGTHGRDMEHLAQPDTDTDTATDTATDTQTQTQTRRDARSGYRASSAAVSGSIQSRIPMKGIQRRQMCMCVCFCVCVCVCACLEHLAPPAPPSFPGWMLADSTRCARGGMCAANVCLEKGVRARGTGCCGGSEKTKP
jgi:hypothetical protein